MSYTAQGAEAQMLIQAARALKEREKSKSLTDPPFQEKPQLSNRAKALKQNPKSTIISFEVFKENPQKFNLLTFQNFKHQRQKRNPRKIGRPSKGYISHKKAYENYLETSYRTYLNAFKSTF